MSQVAAKGVARPTIGDILLSLGFVDAETLAAAAQAQQETGKPLGQILVDRGLITRLELASALAEQWAEAPAPGKHTAERVDDSPWSAPSALAEFDRLAPAPALPETFVADLAEVQVHLDASLERLGGLESGLVGMSARLDQLTDGLEEAFREMQAGASELAEQLATTAAAVAGAATADDLDGLREALDTRLADLVASIQSESQRLNEARDTLTALVDRPAVDPGIEGRIEAIAASLDGAAHSDDLAQLRAQLEALDERLAATADAESLAAVRLSVDELSARTGVSPELESRLAEIEAHVSTAVGADVVYGLQETVAELGARLATAADRALLEELTARVEALAEPGMGDEARLEALETLVAGMSARVESLGALAASGPGAEAIEELQGALEELGRRRHGDEETVARLDDLATAVEELAARPVLDPALADRVEALATTLAELAANSEVADLRAAVDTLADRGGAGESALAELAGRIDELGSRLESSQADALLAELLTDVESIRARLETDDASLAELRAAATELAARPAGDPELAARLTSLTARVDELAAETAAAAAAAHDSSIVEQLGDTVTSARDELLSGLEGVTERVAALEEASRPQAGAAIGAADLDALREAMADDLRAGLERITAEAPAKDVAWLDEAARLGERLDALAALVGDGAPAAAAAKEKPGSRAKAQAPAAPESDTERELERLRMAIERMGMHLSEQERALVDVMRTRGMAERLDELEARLDEVASGAVGNGAVAAPGAGATTTGGVDARALARRLDGAEAALQAEREKMLTKLDRMASSIDWRLQRLEARDAGEEPT